MSAHAILSCSGSKKWIPCGPSARLEQHMPEERSEYAELGTIGHSMVESALRGYLLSGETAGVYWLSIEARGSSEVNQLVGDERAAEEFASLRQAVYDCFDFAVERIKTARSVDNRAQVYPERKVSTARYVPEGFGTSDLCLVYADTIEIIDWKFGVGIPIYAQENSQARLYALANYWDLRDNESSLGKHLDVETVVSTIVQPRLDSISTERISLDELLGWGDWVRPLAKRAWRGDGEFVPGKHCTDAFCKARVTCKARVAWLQQHQQTHEHKHPALFDHKEVAELYAIAPQALRFWKDLADHARDLAVKGAVELPGFKVVRGRSERIYTDTTLVKAQAEAHGVTLDKLVDSQLRSPAQLEKVIGKAKFKELFVDTMLVTKPDGALVLVEESDPREAVKVSGPIRGTDEFEAV